MMYAQANISFHEIFDAFDQHKDHQASIAGAPNTFAQVLKDQAAPSTKLQNPQPLAPVISQTPGYAKEEINLKPKRKQRQRQK